MNKSKFNDAVMTIRRIADEAFAIPIGLSVILIGNCIRLGRRIQRHFLPEDAMATKCIFWSNKYNDIVEDAVKMYETGDNVCFTYKGQDYERPNTSVIWYTHSAKRRIPVEKPAYYFTATLLNGTCVENKCSHYEPDPACQDSPGYLIYSGDYTFHIAKDNVTFTPIAKQESGDT